VRQRLGLCSKGRAVESVCKLEYILRSRASLPFTMVSVCEVGTDAERQGQLPSGLGVFRATLQRCLPPLKLARPACQHACDKHVNHFRIFACNPATWFETFSNLPFGCLMKHAGVIQR